MKIEEKSVFSFENNKSLLYFGEISFLEHYQKPTKGAKQNWALDQKSKVPAYWKTIKAQHENPLEYIYTYTYIQNSSNIFTKLHPVNQTGQISKNSLSSRNDNRGNTNRSRVKDRNASDAEHLRNAETHDGSNYRRKDNKKIHDTCIPYI